MKKYLAIGLTLGLLVSATAWAVDTVRLIGGNGSIGVIVDATIDAAGDLLVGAGDNTAERLAIGSEGKFPRSNGTTLSYSTVTETSGALTGITTAVVSTSVSSPSLISASNADITITPNGTGDIRLGLDSGTALYSSTTFSLDADGNLDAGGTGNFTGALTGGSLNTAGAITIPTFFTVSAAGALEAASTGSFTGALTGGSLNTAGAITIPTKFTVSAAGALDADSYGNFSYLKFGADPADAGVIRLSNATYVMSEADAAGTDISVIGVDSGEIVQIGASGASGVTVTPALTVTGGLVSPKMSGHVTSTGTAPTASAGTIDTKSTDHVGRVTAVGATSTIITFAAAYSATPACVATATDAAVWIVGASTTGFTPTATGNIEDLSYACFEIE